MELTESIIVCLLKLLIKSILSYIILSTIKFDSADHCIVTEFKTSVDSKLDSTAKIRVESATSWIGKVANEIYSKLENLKFIIANTIVNIK